MTIQRYFALGLACLSLAPCAFSQPPEQDARALAAFKDALNRDGFDVTAGGTSVFNLVAQWCASTPGVPNALYANNQPYLQLQVPKSAQDPYTLSPAFKLGAQEAIVLIGLTPPPERYFGIYPFLTTRVIDGTRQSLFATLGDTVNHATVKTVGPSPFNSLVAVIFTPDQGTDARVRKALERAGYPAAVINTIVFPASMLNLGHSDTADELFLAMRNAYWQNEADGDAYIRNPPLHLVRVTPRAETIANPFPAPRLRVRGTGQTEMDLMKKLDQLRDAIIAANPTFKPKDLPPQPAAYEGYDFIQRGVDPWGDTRDAFLLAAGYVPRFASAENLTLAPGEFLVVYGINHVATGKATYTSFTVYSDEGKVPIRGVDDRRYSGTAAPYLPGDPDAASLMYAYKFSWNCAQEPNCVTLALDYNCPRLTIGPNTVLALWFRAYVEPATKVGPAMPEILYDRVIKFSPR